MRDIVVVGYEGKRPVVVEQRADMTYPKATFFASTTPEQLKPEADTSPPVVAGSYVIAGGAPVPGKHDLV